MIAAALIFLATLALVIWQPKGLGIGWSAAGGALASLLAGTVTLADIPAVWSIVWNASGTLIGLIVMTLLLDEAGLFRWAALGVCRMAKGSGRALFALVVLFGAAASALLANDGAVLILTPIVTAILAVLGFPKHAVLAFVMAAGFIVDTASLPLVTSNLVNIISADFFGAGFSAYASVMIPVDLASVAASLAVLYLCYRRWIPAAYDCGKLPAAASAVRDPVLFRAGLAVLVLVPAGCFAADPLGIPVCAVTGAAAALLALLSRVRRVVPLKRVLKDAPWQIVVFSLGMYLVVYGLRNAGLTAHLSSLLTWLSTQGLWASVFGTGFLAAGLSSVMNNLPSVMAVALSVEGSGAGELAREAMFYANAVGCDLGPKITPLGSLATLLWLHVLSHKGLRITWGYYFRVGLELTLPVLAVTLAALALRLAFA